MLALDASLFIPSTAFVVLAHIGSLMPANAGIQDDIWKGAPWIALNLVRLHRNRLHFSGLDAVCPVQKYLCNRLITINLGFEDIDSSRRYVPLKTSWTVA